MDAVKKGRVYKIYSLINPDDFYIGSTFNCLSTRWQQHKHSMSNMKNNMKLVQLMREIGYENFTIIELEECEGTRTKLRLLEGKYQKELKPNLNSRCEGLTWDEYYQMNKEKIIAQNRHYYQENRERISEMRKEYTKEHKEIVSQTRKEYVKLHKEQIAKQRERRQVKIICECGRTISKQHMSVHKKTIIHQNLMKNKN